MEENLQSVIENNNEQLNPDAQVANTQANTQEPTSVTEPATLEENNPAEAPSDEVAQPEPPQAEPSATDEGNPAPATDEEPEDEPVSDIETLSREELVDRLKSILDNDIEKIKNQVATIRARFNDLTKEVQQANYQAFLDGGGLKEDFQNAEDSLSESFRKLYNIYRERRQKHIDDIENKKKQNLAEKQQILDELRQLIDKDEETLKNTYDQFNAIQDKWKNIGDVPRENINDLWQNYHFLIEQFFNKVKINKELRDLDFKRNLEQKITLCEKAEELIVETSIVKAFKALQDLRDKWREIGPVPQEHNEEVWQRFCNAADQVNQRRKEYYDQRREEFERNQLAKQALLDKATELTDKTPESIKQWNDTTAELDELLKIWKTIGPAPRESNEEIWANFKGKIDKFYQAKKEYFNQMRDEETDNYNRKIDLCLKAEAIAKREDWKKATDELLQLQAEWKAIGHTNRKVSEKIWQRFRGACDEFFNKKNEFFKDIRSSESENLAKKEAIIAQLKDFSFGEDKEENLRVIKDFQRQWMEIGYVPIKEKDRLQKEFRNVINEHFEKLKISAREAEENAFRERIRNVAGGAKNIVSSERQSILEKIDKLRADLNLWENNLGFLANSKQADLLKQEFEKKMQGARSQIALLQAKLRILDEAEKETDKSEE